MKIPFDIKFRPQIESGEYRVETRDGKPARIVCWDKKSKFNQKLLVLVCDGNAESAQNYREDGVFLKSRETIWDLFIITPEPELSEFEKELESFYNHHLQVCTYDNQGTVEESLHDGASKLLALAKKELLSEKMLIGQTYNPDINKAHELGRKEGIMLGKAEALKEIEQDPESSYAFKRGVEYGKEEALKDLPRWDESQFEMDVPCVNLEWLHVGKKMIYLPDLEKLPGFND